MSLTPLILSILTSLIRYLEWSCSPACTELEAIVMDWAAQMLGLSPEFHNSSGVGGGVIQVYYIDPHQHSVGTY